MWTWAKASPKSTFSGRQSLSRLLEPRATRSLSRKFIDGIATDIRGGVAITFALVFTGAIGAVGLSIDYARLTHMQTTMQGAADAAAFAAAKEMSLADAKQENIPEIVKAVVRKYADADGALESKAETEIRNQPLQVEVRLEKRVALYFGGLFGMPSTTVEVLSIAQVVGQPNLCVLALEGREPAAINMTHNARLTGSNCAVFSNSSSGGGFAVASGAQLVASTVCSAGGIVGQGSIAPAPYQDCPQFEDPLGGRPEPTIGRCDHIAKIVAARTVTLKPGTYCLGLSILGLSKVTFEPGVYIIKDGPFLVAGASEITGHGVGFFLTGISIFTFDPLTRIELSAPTAGPLAGLLFFGSRSQSKLLINTILSDRAHVMTGTIYLPTTTFVADSLAQIGSDSAYTAIVSRRLLLMDGPHLVLNTRYSETDVPVPEGIRAAGQPVRLVK